MEKETAEVTVTVDLEGVENVNAGFRQIGEAASTMGKDVGAAVVDCSEKAVNMGREMKYLGREIAVLGSSAFAVAKLGESFGLLDKQTANTVMTMGSMAALFGTVVRGLGYLADASHIAAIAEGARAVAHGFANAMSSGITAIASGVMSALRAIASSSVAVAIAENARALASAIANAVSSLGIAVPIMIAAAAAAAVGIAAYTGAIKIPGLAGGGIVTQPTFALIGERGPEAVVPLTPFMPWIRLPSSSSNTTLNFTINEARSPRDTAEEVILALRRTGII